MQQPNQTNVKRKPKKSILNTKQVLEKPKQIPSGPSKTDRINLYYTENQLTRKKDIVWRKNVTYQTPNINWYHPITPQIVELESRLYFFRKYFTDDLFNIMAYNTNLYAVQQHAKFAPTYVMPNYKLLLHYIS